jgi:small subunit ribosomal protein S9
MDIKRNLVVNGKRKTAIAKAVIKDGRGMVLINKKPYENFDFFRRLMIQEPLEIAKKVLGDVKADISVNVMGGGLESQTAASRLAIARALLKFADLTKGKDVVADLKKEFLRYDKNLLVADTRRKEAYKPGDSKARRKRQKSFR